MKSTDTVQMIILIVAVMSGFRIVLELPQLLWLIWQWFDEGLRMTGYFSAVITSILFVSILFITVIILVRNSGFIAHYIVEKSSYQGILKISYTKHDLLSVVFIGIGIYMFITRLPKLATALYDHFKEKQSGLGDLQFNYAQESQLPVLIMELVLALLLLIYAGQFTDYFVKKTKYVDVIDEIGDHIEPSQT